jgi:hypothetical protein
MKMRRRFIEKPYTFERPSSAHSDVDILTENTEMKEVAAQLFQTWGAAWLPCGGDVAR